MKVLGSKKEKQKISDQKFSQTTAQSSHNHSRRNSSFLTISKDSQTVILPPQQLIFLPETKRNKKCLNITVNKSKAINPKTERVTKHQRRASILNFNFCQQVSNNKQNFYTQIIEVDKIQQTLYQPLKSLGKSKERRIFHKRAISTLSCPKSPINQLVELLNQSEDDLAVELQNLLERI